VIKKLEAMIEMLTEMPKLSSQPFSETQLKPILQELLKSKYTFLQTKTLDCFLKLNSKNEIMKQHSSLLKNLINKQT